MPVDEGLSLILQELGGLSRRAVFAGADLPRGREGWLAFGGTHRGREAWYPGSPEPTTQLLGPEENELTFSGELRRGRARLSALSPFQLMTRIEDMRKAGELVNVSYGPIAHRCRWGSAEFKVHTLDHIMYTIRLQIIRVGRGMRVRVVRAPRDVPTVASVVQAAREALAVLSVLPVGLGGDRIQRAQSQVNGVISTATQAGVVLDGFRQIGATIAPGAAQPALRQIDSLRELTRGALENTRALDWTSMSGQGFGVLSTAGSGALQAIAALTNLAGESLKLHARVRVLAGNKRSDVVHIVSQDESLRWLAARFYGSADRWREIANANGIETSDVMPGTQLTIPGVGLGVEDR